MSTPPTVLDPTQLRRIEAVHRGFLYQHLYAAGCLLMAAQAGASAVVVEADEDLEIAFPDRRLYIQVKTRTASLTPHDIDSVFERFAEIRKEHLSFRRQGVPEFVVIANVHPSSALAAKITSVDWPTDVSLYWPGNAPANKALPPPWVNISEAVSACAALAETLPFGSLIPETLIWKLTGVISSAASGTYPRADHAFSTDELPSLFEQLVLQLQDFPAPPLHYRSQEAEPDLTSEARVRIITGFSGAGKTMWVAQAAQHSTAVLAYFDVSDTPSSAISIPLARELAARFFGKKGGTLGQLLLPGATGAEMLRAIALRLQAEKVEATIVVDNAHRVVAEDLTAILNQMPQVRFVLLAQPSEVVQEIQATLRVMPEPLQGWTIDTIAADVADSGCRADYATCARLRTLTAGLPLFVQNATQIAATEYGGEISRLCSDIEARTHDASLAQEIILARVFTSLNPRTRDAIAILCLADIPLERAEAKALLEQTIGLDERSLTRAIKELRRAGVVELLGERLKLHDAIRVLGQEHLDMLGAELRRSGQVVLKNILLTAIFKQKDVAKLSLYLRLLADLGEIKTLVEFATDEIFHEMGLIEQLSAMLESSANSETNSPKDRFDALDGLAFGDFKRNDIRAATKRITAMERLVTDYQLDDEAQLTLAMKAMNLAARQGDAERVSIELEKVTGLVPDNPAHLRILRYNAAHALYDLGHHEECVSITHELIPEYYDELGLTIADVMNKNPDKIWPLIKNDGDHADDLKHLADCLDLQAHSLDKLGQQAPFARIHAMKFYSMANALDSFVRVGQDLVDEFVARHDYIGAREVLERNVLPAVIEQKMISRIVPVRSQYAVVLAYCGDHSAAATEMAKLVPYETGLSPDHQEELRQQRQLIAQLRHAAPAPQWQFPAVPFKMGRNERCYCGSGKKYKFCHGRQT
jgi:hypothetical protein